MKLNFNFVLFRLLPDNLQEMFRKIVHIKVIPDSDAKEIIEKYKECKARAS